MTNLNERFLKTVASHGAHRRISDGRNLYLNVAKTGAMSWLYIWLDKSNGKQREIGLGSYTGAGRAIRVSLDDARMLADEIRKAIRDGKDPIAERKSALVGPATFAQMLALAIENGKPGWKADADGNYGQQADWEAKIALYAAHLMTRPVATLTKQDVFDVVGPIWKTKHKTADTVRYVIWAAIEAAIADDKFVGNNPATKALCVGKFGKKAKGKDKKQPSLAYVKVPAAIAKLLADGRMAAKASVFCTLTATRTDEARLMKWSEVDFDASMWVVPSERMKVLTDNDIGGDHAVPLSDAAITLLRSLPRTVGNDYVFTGTLVGKPVGETALNDMITKNRNRGGLLELAGEATQHGMRASFRTWAKARKFNDDAAELCLAHTIGTKTTRSYDREAMMADRAEIMQAWGVHCLAANVVAFERSAA